MTDNNGTFFDDMWLALEKELTSYDNFISDNDWMHSTPDDSQMKTNPDQFIEAPNLSPETYEDLVHQNEHGPSKNELRSKSRQERIEAVRQLYNQVPTIINAESIFRLQKVASTLYKRGSVKTANALMAEINSAFRKTSLSEQMAKGGSKHIEIEDNNGKTFAKVIIQEQDNSSTNTIERTFEDVSQAIEFYLNPED